MLMNEREELNVCFCESNEKKEMLKDKYMDKKKIQFLTQLICFDI